MRTLSESVVAIVGCGLIGGSLAMALRAHGSCRRILAVTWDEAERREVLARQIADEASTNLALVSQADVIVLATPVRTILEQLPRVGTLAKQDAIIMDVGSTKREIVQAMQDLPLHVQPIGGHPMCGKETAGLGAANAALFQDAVFVIVPLARTSPDALRTAQDLTQSIGARPLLLDADTHDRVVAVTSHLPFVLAAALVAVAMEQNQRDSVAQLTASGFRDTSRLAASDTRMMLDTLLTNREHVAEMANAAANQLRTLADLIQSGDEEALEKCLRAAAAGRPSLYRERTG